MAQVLLTVSPSVSHVSFWTQSAYRKQQNGNIACTETFEKGLTAVEKDDILRSWESLMLVGAYDRTFSAMFVKTLGKLRLYHLQVLDTRDWSGLDGLPRGMCNLVNLRYLLVPESGSSHLHSKIARFGQLQFLQVFKEYQVQTESGFEISQLENLNDIGGSLRICNLENIVRTNEASGARIKDKRHLTTLSLSWGRSSDPTFQKEVLEGLQPHDRLEHLHIINYIGVTPSWLGQDFSLNNLESLLHGNGDPTTLQ